MLINADFLEQIWYKKGLSELSGKNVTFDRL